MATETVTYSNPATGKDYASGLLLSDGTIAYIDVGFIPSKIVLTHYTGTNPLVYMWAKGQTSGSYWLLTGATGVITKVESGGPTVYGDTQDDVYGASESADFQGFQIPDALLADNDTWQWEVWR